MEKDFLNPSNLPDWSDTFSQVVVVRTGSTRTIHVSGQVAVDADKRVVAPGDLEGQTNKALENLRAALEAAGATTRDIVRLGVFVKNYHQGHAPIIGDALRRLFGEGPMPASTWLGVATLALDDLLVEIEAVAIVASDEKEPGRERDGSV